MDEDVAGVRSVLAPVPEALIAYSCDKNFGLYRDRVGAFYVMAQDGGSLDTILSNANALARATWSMPPDHGGAAVRIALRDPDLTKEWRAELDEMRERMRDVRRQLAAADGDARGSQPRRAGRAERSVRRPAAGSSDQIAALRDEHAIYMAGSGRINIAGLHEGNIGKFIAALADVTRA